MANTWTDYGINRMLDITFRSATGPTACSVRLLSTLTGSGVDNEDWSGISANEVANGNGYTTGGATVALSNVGFDVLSDDSANNRQYLQLADVSWTASGGSITAAGAALVMTDGGTDKVWAIFDFSGSVTASDGGTLTMQNCELRVGV
jgi:hypothetical protein